MTSVSKSEKVFFFVVFLGAFMYVSIKPDFFEVVR